MTPLQYAAYYDSIKCFNYLFLLESDSKTQQQLVIPAIGISPKCRYVLPKHATVIEIILLRGSINCLKSYNTYMKELKEVNKIYLNDLKITPLHISVLCKQEISLLYFKNLTYQQQYINTPTKDNMTVLMYICYFGRFDLFSFLLDNIHKFSDMEEKCIVKEQSAIAFMKHMKIIKSYLRQQLNNKDDNMYTAYDYIKIIFEDQLGLTVDKKGKQEIFQLWDQFLFELNRGAKTKLQRQVDIDKFDVKEEQPQKKEKKQDVKKDVVNEKALGKETKQTKTEEKQEHKKEDADDTPVNDRRPPGKKQTTKKSSTSKSVKSSKVSTKESDSKLTEQTEDKSKSETKTKDNEQKDQKDEDKQTTERKEEDKKNNETVNEQQEQQQEEEKQQEQEQKQKQNEQQDDQQQEQVEQEQQE